MTHINSLLKKLREGKCSDKELNELDILLKIPAYEDAADSSMYMHWKECDNSATGDEKRFTQTLNEIHHIINIKSRKSTIIRHFYLNFSRVAAILLIPLTVAFYLLGLNQHNNNITASQNTVNVPLGATSNFILPDGTEVMLNSGSKLTYPMSFESKDNRTVALNGEGYFRVKKDKKKPFMVNMNGLDVKVTGTTFNARAYEDETNVVVALAEGSVLLGDTEQEKSFENMKGLKPNDVAVFNKNTRKMELIQNADLTKYLAWTHGLTVFDNDPIQTVIEKLEKLYNVEVIISDKELLNYRLTATFTGEPLEQALNIISLSSSVNCQILSDGKDKYGIYGKRTLVLKKKKR